MRGTAMTNWTNAKSSNGSDLAFNEVESISTDPLAIEVRKASVSALPDAWGLIQFGQSAFFCTIGMLEIPF
jgi:hypothetical protein